MKVFIFGMNASIESLSPYVEDTFTRPTLGTPQSVFRPPRGAAMEECAAIAISRCGEILKGLPLSPPSRLCPIRREFSSYYYTVAPFQYYEICKISADCSKFRGPLRNVEDFRAIPINLRQNRRKKHRNNFDRNVAEICEISYKC